MNRKPDQLLPAAIRQHIDENRKASSRQLAHFGQCDPAYAVGVARALKLEAPDDDRLKGTSATDQPRESPRA